MSAASAQSPKAGNTIRLEGVTCPFCPLLCDDLVIERTGDQLKVVNDACPHAKATIEAKPKTLTPRVKGKAVSLDEAIEAAAGILRDSNQPLLGGLGTDVAGMRASVALAESTGGILDHMHGDALNNNYRVLQSRGWMTTTLTEVRNRADLVLFVGTDAGQYHRFYERAIFPESTLFGLKSAERKLVYLGNGLQPGKVLSKTQQKQAQQLKCPPEALGEVIGALSALVNEQPLSNKVAGIKPADLQALADQLQTADYSVIAWAPGELPVEHGEAIIDAICQLVESLNTNTRSSGFIFGGHDGATTAVNVCAWLTGYPLRVSFANGYPEYDPAAFATDTLLAEGAVDSVMWLSTLQSQSKAPDTGKLPTVVIADSDKACDTTPDVFIPAGIPGIDHAGTMIRGDSVVSLPLQQLRETSDRASATDIIQAIHAKL